MIGLEGFEVIPDTAEEVLPLGSSPEGAVCSVALQKAKNVSQSCGFDDIIIAADTEVYLDGRPLGKPEGPDCAARMLRSLSGRRHSVYTGIAIVRGSCDVTAAEVTDVYFRELADFEIDAYVSTGEPMDKAGAYAAQGRGSVFIERLEGDFYNVMGLPLHRLYLMLREFCGLRPQIENGEWKIENLGTSAGCRA